MSTYTELEVGDRVRGQYDEHKYTGTVYSIEEDSVEVIRDNTGNKWSCKIRGNGEVAGAYNFDDGIHNLQLISSTEPQQEGGKGTIIMRLNTMMKKILDKDTKTLIKAGYLNGDLQLTETGRESLEALLVEEKKEALVKLAEETIEEQKSEK